MLKSSEPSKSKKSFFSEWLEKLQQESWQLELLISGLALFGIWESRRTIRNFSYYLDTNTVPPFDFYGEIFISILWAGWGIFMVNLLIHIIIRGLWIGAIGLRYVSGDIDFNELNYSEVFTKFFNRRIGSFDDYIERLEKLSSVLFSFTFLLFFMFFSFMFFNIVYVAVISISGSIFNVEGTQPPLVFILFTFIYYGLGLLVLIDFFTLGGFKRVKDKSFSVVYLWIYRFYTTISLSFIYRPLLLNFVDNRYTRTLFFLALPYVLILLFGFRLSSFERYSFIPSFHGDERYPQLVDKYSVNWNNYDDLRLEHNLTYSDSEIPIKKTRIRTASLNRYEIAEESGKIFLKYRISDSRLLSRQNPDFSIFKKTGFIHRIFSKKKVNDPEIERLIKEEVAAIRGMQKVLRGRTSSLDSAEQVLIQEDLYRYQSLTEDDIPDLRNEIEAKYSGLRKEFINSKMVLAQEAIMKNYELQIDSTSYIDSLSCYFYTHPNMHEQGLLCHFPTQVLSKGQHMIYLKKYVNRDECTDNCPYIEKYIPFRKI